VELSDGGPAVWVVGRRQDASVGEVAVGYKMVLERMCVLPKLERTLHSQWWSGQSG
jgi:hypothetical protein